MSVPKDFLSRWSRRKLEADEAKDSAPAGEKAALPVEMRKENSAAPPVPEFDLTTLPSLESIGANSDISVFLQRGVPASLTRAALRRAWSTDPAIRDFVGLSENSWDFNAPDSIPGFGSLDASEVKRIAAQFFGKADEEATGQAAAPVQPAPEPTESAGARAQETQTVALADMKTEAEGVQTARESDNNAGAVAGAKPIQSNAATQYQERADDLDSTPVQRRHGGALPE